MPGIDSAEIAPSPSIGSAAAGAANLAAALAGGAGLREALVLANAALGEGIETHLFFTFWGMDVIVCTTAETDDEARELLRAFNFPFPAPKEEAA